MKRDVVAMLLLLAIVCVFVAAGCTLLVGAVSGDLGTNYRPGIGWMED